MVEGIQCPRAQHKHPGPKPALSSCALHGERRHLSADHWRIRDQCGIHHDCLFAVSHVRPHHVLLHGIAGVNPEVATIASVTFARFAVQGYVALGAENPTQYPGVDNIYGTEVFELNTLLRDMAIGYARTAPLNDSAAAKAYRAHYATTPAYAAGAIAAFRHPMRLYCRYYSGALLSEAFGNYSRIVTNNTAVYCTTAQEDNATLEALLRAALYKLVDYSRVIVMRTASDFDRPYAGEPDTVNLFYANQGAFGPAIRNIYLCGVKVVMGIKSPNYVGDIFNTLGGTPDFGIPADWFTKSQVISRRDLGSKRRRALPSFPINNVVLEA
ncbi:hypothetical protein MRB53_042167 [Persea americana]|nr:hypothetical protein MRB53_042167 [Persea americana]